MDVKIRSLSHRFLQVPLGKVLQSGKVLSLTSHLSLPELSKTGGPKNSSRIIQIEWLRIQALFGNSTVW